MNNLQFLNYGIVSFTMGKEKEGCQSLHQSGYQAANETLLEVFSHQNRSTKYSSQMRRHNRQGDGSKCKSNSGLLWPRSTTQYSLKTTKPAYYLTESETTDQPIWAVITETEAQSGGRSLSPDHSHAKRTHNSSPTLECESPLALIHATREPQASESPLAQTQEVKNNHDGHSFQNSCI